jgi:4-amino-4-deoxy-L-arabinose transferase-like glycosyltransferase
MNTGSTLHAEEEAVYDLGPAIIGRSAAPATGVEGWIVDHLDFLAFLVVAAGAVLRVLAATRSYLNPDEALHYLLLNQPSAFLAYKASLTNAHPPLIYMVAYFWHFLGRSEWMLRMPSVVAGTAFCWMFYKWMGLAFGRPASWIGLILATFSPAMIALSAELRAYALLLFGLSSALYFLERAFAEKSAPLMWGFTGFLYLSILTHYSTAFFAVATGVYVLARISDGQLPRKVISAWATGQVGALAIYAFLYVTHLSKLKNSIAIWSTSFGTAYFQRDSMNLFTFTWRNTFGIFLFLFGQPYVALAILLCSVGGVAFFFGGKLLSRKNHSQPSRFGILLLFPFIAVWCAAIAGIYPFIGSRHTVFLAPFAFAAGSYFLAAACGRRVWVGVMAAAVLMGFSITAHGAAPTEEMTENQSPALMTSAITYMEQSIPRGDHILLDYQSSIPFEFYFCGPKVMFPIETFHGDYFDFSCKGDSAVVLHQWKLLRQTFPGEFQAMARTHGLKPGDRVWLFQTGWGTDMGTDLASHDPAFRCINPKQMGGGITITPFVVGPDFYPSPSLGGC